MQSTRRAFLRFLAGSPLLLSELARGGDLASAPIEAPAQAVDVFDFRAVAERRLLPAHWTYLAMGVDDEFTLRENREAFSHWRLRPRRLVDTRAPDTSTDLLGTKLSCPIVLAPVGSQKTYHAEGELAVARAARRLDHLQILSMGSSTPLDEVSAARDAPLWLQLYPPRIWPAARWLLREAEGAGCPTLVLTVDVVMPGENRLRIRRFRRDENPECQPCHASALDPVLRGAASVARAAGFEPRDWLADTMTLDWAFFDRMRDATPLKLLIKGILTPEDARLAVEHGADGVIVSNHGGRADDVGLATRPCSRCCGASWKPRCVLSARRRSPPSPARTSSARASEARRAGYSAGRAPGSGSALASAFASASAGVSAPSPSASAPSFAWKRSRKASRLTGSCSLAPTRSQ